jgi:uncharacterized repeat protein (TIGR03803 family)
VNTMTDSQCINRCLGRVLLAGCLLAAPAFLPVTSTAQTYLIVHSFSGPDGANPQAGLTVDAAWNFYGTTASGGTGNGVCGSPGCGTVFKMSRKGAGWVLATLYRFQGGDDGAFPTARVVFGPDGALYGTTQGQGGFCTVSCGSVFRLTPPATFCAAVSCPWRLTVLYKFLGGVDGSLPGWGDLLFDRSGNIYGTTTYGGDYNAGTVFKVTHAGSQWTQSVLYSFHPEDHGPTDGSHPYGGLTFDDAGNLLGTTLQGGFPDAPEMNYGAGTVFQLTPTGSGWTETIVQRFLDGGQLPAAGLAMTTDGRFYGTTTAGGLGNCSISFYNGCGTVYLENFSGGDGTVASLPGMGSPAGPRAPVTFDVQNNIYGTTAGDGAFRAGNVFKLTGSQYVYSSLHDFSGGDGAIPYSNVVFDSGGDLYGTTSSGGNPVCGFGCGVIWQITP